MKSSKIIYRIAVLLSVFFVLNCGGLSTTNGGGHGPDDGGNHDPSKSPKIEATPTTFQELVDVIDKKYKADHNADLNVIDVSKITTMHCLFSDILCLDETSKRPTELTGKDFHLFNGKIDKWKTGNVKNMRSMFERNKNFSGDLSHWDVSNVIDMQAVFASAYNFNSDVTKWKVSNVTTMSHMFAVTLKFNRDISGWDVRKVTDITAMFQGTPPILGTPGKTVAMSYNLEAWGSKLPQGVAKFSVFTGSVVARNNNYPTWCTLVGHCK